MSTPIKGSFLPDLASLLGVPRRQRMEPLRVVRHHQEEPRGASRHGPQNQLDPLMGLLGHLTESRPAWTLPSASPASRCPQGPGHPPSPAGETVHAVKDGVWWPHAQDVIEQGHMPTRHRGDRWPGLPPWLRRRHAERQGKPNPSALGRQVPWPVPATSWAGFGADSGEVGGIRAPGRRFRALSTTAQGQGNATSSPPLPTLSGSQSVGADCWGVGGGEGWSCGARETAGCRGCTSRRITVEMPA